MVRVLLLIFNNFISIGWIIFMTVTNSDAALHMIPSFEEYDNGTEFLSFACLESDYSEISLEWLDPNGNVMIPTTETARIDGNTFLVANSISFSIAFINVQSIVLFLFSIFLYITGMY